MQGIKNKKAKNQRRQNRKFHKGNAPAARVFTFVAQLPNQRVKNGVSKSATSGDHRDKIKKSKKNDLADQYGQSAVIRRGIQIHQYHTNQVDHDTPAHHTKS